MVASVPPDMSLDGYERCQQMRTWQGDSRGQGVVCAGSHPPVEPLERERIHSRLVRPEIFIPPLRVQSRARALPGIYAGFRAHVAAVEAKVRRRAEGSQEPIGLEPGEGVGPKVARGPLQEKFIHLSGSLHRRPPIYHGGGDQDWEDVRW